MPKSGQQNNLGNAFSDLDLVNQNFKFEGNKLAISRLKISKTIWASEDHVEPNKSSVAKKEYITDYPFGLYEAVDPDEMSFEVKQKLMELYGARFSDQELYGTEDDTDDEVTRLKLLERINECKN